MKIHDWVAHDFAQAVTIFRECSVDVEGKFDLFAQIFLHFFWNTEAVRSQKHALVINTKKTITPQ